MKSITKITTILLILTMTSISLTISFASAETTISVPIGSSVTGCEETNECYIPYEINVAVGETVTWSNDDTAAHTVTSGTVTDGPDGTFDSSLFMAGTIFSHTFEDEGTFDYFCMVHPWMTGSIIVGEANTESSDMTKEEKSQDKEMTNIKEDMKEHSQEKELTMAEPSANEVEFTVDYDITGGNVANIAPDTEANSFIVKMNADEQGILTIIIPRKVMDSKFNGEDDDFFILIDGEEVDITETKTDTDRTLEIEFPAGTEEIEVIGTFMVPEFGTITAMILTIAIISIIVISAKSRLSVLPRF